MMLSKHEVVLSQELHSEKLQIKYRQVFVKFGNGWAEFLYVLKF